MSHNPISWVFSVYLDISNTPLDSISQDLRDNMIGFTKWEIKELHAQLITYDSLN